MPEHLTCNFQAPQPSSACKFQASPLLGPWLPHNFSSLAREIVFSFHSSAEPPREKGESIPSFYLRKWRPWKSSHLSKITLIVRAPSKSGAGKCDRAFCEPLRACTSCLLPTGGWTSISASASCHPQRFSVHRGTGGGPSSLGTKISLANKEKRWVGGFPKGLPPTGKPFP